MVNFMPSLAISSNSGEALLRIPNVYCHSNNPGTNNDLPLNYLPTYEDRAIYEFML